MPIAWRLVKRKFAADAFKGAGARTFGGRWNSPGTSVVYCAEHVSLAALEILVRLRDPGPLAAYSLIRVEFADRLVRAVAAKDLPAEWAAFPAPAALRAIGDRWTAGLESVVLRVPSALIESECNYLLNPQHPDFARVEIGEPQDFVFDPRFLTP